MGVQHPHNFPHERLRPESLTESVPMLPAQAFRCCLAVKRHHVSMNTFTNYARKLHVYSLSLLSTERGK